MTIVLNYKLHIYTVYLYIVIIIIVYMHAVTCGVHVWIACSPVQLQFKKCVCVLWCMW